jgi:hypothetical protein
MLAAGLALYPVNRARGADAPDPVLSLMLEKGMITQDEAAKVQAQVDALHTNEVAQTPYLDSKWKISTGIKDIELYGDLRTRFEDRMENDPSGGKIELERYRFAARVGLRGDLYDDFYYGFRLETSSNPRSTMVTLGSVNPDPYSKSSDGINIGQIYLGWHPESWVDLTAGKMPNPLYTSSMVWSPSINPEGLAEQFKHTVGEVDLFANFAQFLYEDLNPVFSTGGLGINGLTGQENDNLFQVAWQGGLIYHVTDKLSVKVAATYYQYFGRQPSTSSSGTSLSPYFGDAYVGEGAYAGPLANTTANYPVNVNGASGYVSGVTQNGLLGNESSLYPNNQVGLNNLEVVEVPFEINFKLDHDKLNARLFGDVAYNLDGAARARAAAAGYAAYLNSIQQSTVTPFAAQVNENTAYQIGFALGSEDALGLVNGTTAKKHAWELRTYWQHIGQYSLDPNLLDLDFNAGAENLQGIYAAAAYGFTDNFIGTFRYGYASRINNQLGTGGTGTDIPQINPITQYSIFQIDLTVKF